MRRVHGEFKQRELIGTEYYWHISTGRSRGYKSPKYCVIHADTIDSFQANRRDEMQAMRNSTQEEFKMHGSDSIS